MGSSKYAWHAMRFNSDRWPCDSVCPCLSLHFSSRIKLCQTRLVRFWSMCVYFIAENHSTSYIIESKKKTRFSRCPIVEQLTIRTRGQRVSARHWRHITSHILRLKMFRLVFNMHLLTRRFGARRSSSSRTPTASSAPSHHAWPIFYFIWFRHYVAAFQRICCVAESSCFLSHP